ncbi:MAG: diol dehydratase reactivase subunit alpha, partial [Propionibacterium sp.]
MQLVAGIDIGNATTEVALAESSGAQLNFLASSIIPTTGIKGTKENLAGIFQALTAALKSGGRSMTDLSQICINEAAPVIGDVAMETITETVITESTMIGHNPATPGGLGVGVGTTILIADLVTAVESGPYIVVADRSLPYDEIARQLNAAASRL